jgi:hypothetical protein
MSDGGLAVRDPRALASSVSGRGLRVDVDQFVSQDDQVIAFGRERMRTKATGWIYEVDWIHAWKLSGCTLVSFRAHG